MAERRLFPTFRGYDTGIDHIDVGPEYAPDCRNWLPSDDVNDAHGPRQGSEPFGLAQFAYPVRHVHGWDVRGGGSKFATFYDNGTNLALQFGLQNVDTETTQASLDKNYVATQAGGSTELAADKYWFWLNSGSPNYTDSSVSLPASPQIAVSDTSIRDYNWIVGQTGCTITVDTFAEGRLMVGIAFIVSGSWTWSRILGVGNIANGSGVSMEFDFPDMWVSPQDKANLFPDASGIDLWIYSSTDLISPGVGSNAVEISDLDLKMAK